jgi:hypothetical protein
MPKSVEERLAAMPRAMREVVAARIEAMLGAAEQSAERLADQGVFAASLDAAIEEGKRLGFSAAAELEAEGEAVIAAAKEAASERLARARGMANASGGATTDEIMEDLRGPWDEFFGQPAADLGEREQPPAPGREDMDR